MSEKLITKSSHEHKYTNKNFFHRFFLNRFLDTVYYEIDTLDPNTILDFGCGEGFFLKAMKDRGLSEKKILGVDNRREAIEKAATLIPEYDFKHIDLFQINPDEFQFDLVIAIEVFEHLYKPETFLTPYIKIKTLFVKFPWIVSVGTTIPNIS